MGFVRLARDLDRRAVAVSAPLPKSLIPLSMTAREKQIEEFMKRHPERVTRVAPVEVERGVAQVAENFDRVQIGLTWGAYRRRKHTGSDDQ